VSSKGLLDSMGIVGTTIKKLGEFWKKQEKSRQRLVIVLGVTGIILAIVLTLLLNTKQYSVLYTNLSIADAGAIMDELKKSGIDAKAEGSNTILVPSDVVDSVRMELAASGFPKNSSNLDILGQSTGFGVTDADKEIYRRYQLQDDLQNAIETFDVVLDARVSLNIPESSSFVIENQQSKATAAVLLTLRVGTSLSAGNVAAISSLVEKSVPGLTADGVSIIDSNMNVLNISANSNGIGTSDQQTMQQQISEKLKKQVLALLQPVFGPSNILAEVSVTLNFDDSSTESVRFEPAAGNTNGVISSIDKIRESSTGGSGASASGTDSNGTTTYPVVGADNSVYEKTSEAVNYEINTIKETLIKAKGTISNLSVSVILNAADGAATDYSDNVRKLVATAIGVSEEYITVDKLPFSGVTSQEDTWNSYQQTNDKAIQWQQTQFFILLGAGILFALLLLSFLFKAFKGSGRSKEDRVAELMPSLRNTSSRQELQNVYANVQKPELTQHEIAMGLLNDASAVQKRKIESYVDTNPELATSIVRGWLSEDQG